MNIAFFLIPKEDVVHLHADSTMRQALEKMEYHRYTAIPLLDDEGRYVATLTEGDLLWKIKSLQGFDFNELEQIKISDLQFRFTNHPVRMDADIEDLISLAVMQNFIPVIDDQDVFVGIIRRREIIEFYTRQALLHETLSQSAEKPAV